MANPDVFYKKIWFWFIVVGILILTIVILFYLYGGLSAQNTYILGALAVVIILAGLIVALFIAKQSLPLKDFRGRELGVTLQEAKEMGPVELERLLSRATGKTIAEVNALSNDPALLQRVAEAQGIR